MAWRPLRTPSKEDIAARRRAKKSWLVVDESLGIGVAYALRDLGYNVVFVGDVGLAGHDDQAVFAFAWRERRLLLTHDRDFLDNARFPENRNPGLAVILAGADGNQADMVRALGHVHGLFHRDPGQWIGTKVVISTGEIQVRRRDWRTGRFVTDRYDVSSRGVREWAGN